MSKTNLSEDQQKRLVELAELAIEHIESIPQDTAGLDISIDGGAVRDAIIGNKSKDLDFTVELDSIETLLSRGWNDVNASSFGVLLDSTGEEWKLTRTETKPESAYGYKGIETNTDNVSLKKDLKRRDFTMNAIALKLSGDIPEDISNDEYHTLSTEYGEVYLIDPYNGVEYIDQGTIKHVSEAFKEDPLRILRAARYKARLEHNIDVDLYTGTIPDSIPFTIAAETKSVMRDMAHKLNLMSKDRIGKEIKKAMRETVDPTRFWDTLKEVGALAVIAPTLDRAEIVPAGPEEYHGEGDTYTHTMMVTKRMFELCEEDNITGTDRVRLLLMATAHDLGKVRVADEKGGLHSEDPPRSFPAHTTKGARVAETMAEQLGLDTHIERAMVDASKHHMEIHDLPLWESDKLTSFVGSHTPPENAKTPYMATVTELIYLAHADHEGRYQDNEHTDTDTINDESAPEGTDRPEFNPDPYHQTVDIAAEAIDSITGYDILRTELEDAGIDHTEIADGELAKAVTQNEECRIPGEWVGEELTQKRTEYINNMGTSPM